MVPVTPAAVSIFGASLNSPSVTASSTAPASLAVGGGLFPVPDSATAPPAPFADLLTEAVGEVQSLLLPGQPSSYIQAYMAPSTVGNAPAQIEVELPGRSLRLGSASSVRPVWTAAL